MEKQIGHPPEDLTKHVKVPDNGEYVWSAFLSLHSGRSYGFNGPEPLTFDNMLAWCKLTGNFLSPWQVDAVKRLDNIFLKVQNKNG